MPPAIEPPPVEPSASTYRWGAHWILCSLMYYRIRLHDEEGYRVVLTEPVDDASLGHQLRLALTSSRLLTLEQVNAYRELKGLKERYERWVRWCLDSTGAKTRRALFKGLLGCSCDVRNGVLDLTPLRRHGAEGWVGIGRDAHVQCPIAGPDEELGRVLRVAMGRAEG